MIHCYLKATAVILGAVFGALGYVGLGWYTTVKVYRHFDCHKNYELRRHAEDICGALAGLFLLTPVLAAAIHALAQDYCK